MPQETTNHLSTSQADGKRDATVERLITFYVMGKAYKVPAETTIMGAIEYAGLRTTRGAGCRRGYCNACNTSYSLPGDNKTHTGLACTTLVEEGMAIEQIPIIWQTTPAKSLVMTNLPRKF